MVKKLDPATRRVPLEVTGPVATNAEGPAHAHAHEEGWLPKRRQPAGVPRFAPLPGVAATPEQASAVTRHALWAALPDRRRAQVRALLEHAAPVGARARAAVEALLADDAFKAKSPAEQANALMSRLRSAPVIPATTITDVPNGRPANQVTVLGSEPGTFEFDGAQVPATKTTVLVGSKRLTLLEPTASAASGQHRHGTAELLKALERVPPSALQFLSELRLAPKPNPSDGALAEAYGRSDFRTYMDCGPDGVVHVYPFPASEAEADSTDTIASTLVHESGHAWSLSRFGPRDSPEWERWREAAAKDLLPVSEYGAASVDEDIAETIVLYLETQGTPAHGAYRAMYPNRFAQLDRLLLKETP